MQGKPFLGDKAAEARRYVYGHRDRVDEVRDLARSVRDGRYLYIRNYMPHLGYNQPTAWPDNGEIRHDFYRLAKPETMSAPQWHFASPTRAVEELYDCQADPQNLNDLTKSGKHREILNRLRAEHVRHITATADLGFLPESEAWELFSKQTGWELGQAGRVPLAGIHQAAAQVGVASERVFLKNLDSDNPTIRYWGAIGLAVRPVISDLAKRKLRRKISDPSQAARIEIANALATHGDIPNALPALIDSMQHENLIVVTHAARIIELLGKKAYSAKHAIEEALKRADRIRPPDTPATIVLPGDKDLAMFVSFSCRAFLNKLNE